MQSRIYGLLSYGKGYQFVSLFGYSTKGIPGLEIVGLGKNSRIIKEKFLYIIKKNNLHIPMRRYILCVENSEKTFDDYSFLELPLFILLLNVQGILNINQLENCFCSGKVQLNGEIIENEIDPNYLKQLSLYSKKMVYYISFNQNIFEGNLLILDLEELFKSFGIEQLKRQNLNHI